MSTGLVILAVIVGNVLYDLMYVWIMDSDLGEKMKLNTYRAGDYSDTRVVEIETLEDLVDLIEATEYDVVFIKPNPKEKQEGIDYHFVIYDDYL